MNDILESVGFVVDSSRDVKINDAKIKSFVDNFNHELFPLKLILYLHYMNLRVNYWQIAFLHT